MESVSSILEERKYAISIFIKVFNGVIDSSFLNAINKYNLLINMPFTDECSHYATALRMSDNFLKIDKDKEKNTIGELGKEFNSLFIGPENLGAPPWESVYVDDNRSVFQESTLIVRKKYLEHEFVIDKYQEEPDDHIVYELSFIDLLNDLLMEHYEKGSKNNSAKLILDQKKFIDAHLVKWVHKFHALIDENSKGGFYSAISSALMYYLPIDQKILDRVALAIES